MLAAVQLRQRRRRRSLSSTLVWCAKHLCAAPALLQTGLDDECPICLAEMQEACITLCKHVFCKCARWAWGTAPHALQQSQPACWARHAVNAGVPTPPSLQALHQHGHQTRQALVPPLPRPPRGCAAIRPLVLELAAVSTSPAARAPPSHAPPALPLSPHGLRAEVDLVFMPREEADDTQGSPGASTSRGVPAEGAVSAKVAALLERLRQDAAASASAAAAGSRSKPTKSVVFRCWGGAAWAGFGLAMCHQRYRVAALLVSALHLLLCLPPRSPLRSQFTSFLNVVEPVLAAEGLATARLDGKTSAKKRAEVLRAFASGAAQAASARLHGGGAGKGLLLLHLWRSPAPTPGVPPVQMPRAPPPCCWCHSRRAAWGSTWCLPRGCTCWTRGGTPAWRSRPWTGCIAWARRRMCTSTGAVEGRRGAGTAGVGAHGGLALKIATRHPHACRYSVEDSIEERIMALQEAKRDLMKVWTCGGQACQHM